MTKPATCLNDASGTGMSRSSGTPRNANTLTFLVDGVRIETATTAAPAFCPSIAIAKHVVRLQAFGATRPSASSRSSASLRPVAPLTIDG
jgi:hypothetical protein